jgi:hypothetical protein
MVSGMALERITTTPETISAVQPGPMQNPGSSKERNKRNL